MLTTKTLKVTLLALLLFVGWRCQAPGQGAGPAAISSPLPSPTPPLIPPIPAGDGSDVLDRLLDAGVLRVGIRVWPEAEFSPPAFRGFSNARTGGALNGFEVDVARQVAEGLGLELELVEAYPPVLLAGDWRGQWDIALASLAPFDQLPADAGPVKAPVVFSEPYGYMPLGVLVPAGENSPRTLDDLAGQKVGVLEDSPYQYLLLPGGQALTAGGRPILAHKLPPGLQPVPVSNLLKAVRELGQPAVPDREAPAALLGPAPVFAEAVKSGLPIRLIDPASPPGYQPLAIAAVSQDGLKTGRLMAEINKALERLKRRGILAEIYLRWYGRDFSQAP